MKKLLSGLFTFPWRLSLVGTWLIVTTVYFLVIPVDFLSQMLQLYFRYFSFVLLWIIGPFVPINLETVFFGLVGFGNLLNGSSSALDYLYCAAPLLILILILSGDWAIQKIRIPRTPTKLLFNLVFLFYFCSF